MFFKRECISIAVMMSMALLAAPIDAKTGVAERHSKASKKNGPVKMIETGLKQCDVRSATVTMVPDDVFTRVAITEQTIEKFGKTVVIPAGDHRIAQLPLILNDLILDAPTVETFDIRMRLQMSCADGSIQTILASRTSSQGLSNMKINGKGASTVYALRPKLEALLAS
jgi:hypothetical protein